MCGGKTCGGAGAMMDRVGVALGRLNTGAFANCCGGTCMDTSCTERPPAKAACGTATVATWRFTKTRLLTVVLLMYTFVVRWL